MEHRVIEREGVRLWSQAEGPEGGPRVVFANALGTDLTLWDAVLPHLPPGLRVLRWDMRGHGRSSVTPAPYTMGALIADAEAVCDGWGVRDCVFVGLSLGGMIAQGLAVKRLDLIRGLVLSNTAARIGTQKLWDERIATVRAGGMATIADGVLARWFGRDFRAGPGMDRWRERLIATPAEGYAGCCAAIAGTDFYTPTASLRLPTLGIAGSEDGSTPPDLVRETVDLIPGSRLALIRRAGHLPCVEMPRDYGRILTDFLTEIGHV